MHQRLKTVLSERRGGPAGPTGPSGPQGLEGPEGAPGPAKSQAWGTFVPSVTTRTTVSTFTPDAAIIVTRIQAQAINAAANCAQPAVLTLNDNANCAVTLSSATNDSGAKVCAFAAGSAIRLTVLQTPSCSGKAGTIERQRRCAVQGPDALTGNPKLTPPGGDRAHFSTAK